MFYFNFFFNSFLIYGSVLRFLRLSRNITILTRWFFSRDFYQKIILITRCDFVNLKFFKKISGLYCEIFIWKLPADNFKIISVNPFSLRDQNRRHQSLWFSCSGLWLVLWYPSVRIWDSQRLLIGGWLLEFGKSGQN